MPPVSSHHRSDFGDLSRTAERSRRSQTEYSYGGSLHGGRQMIGTTEAASLLGICCQRVRQLLQAGRIIGAVKVGRFWQIPLFNGMPKIKPMDRGPEGTWRKRPQQALSIIHIWKQKLDRDRKENTNSPVIAVRQGSRTKYCHSAVINGPSRIIYQPESPLSCGARLWIEVAANVNVTAEIFA